jgi:hypothetical protein
MSIVKVMNEFDVFDWFSAFNGVPKNYLRPFQEGHFFTTMEKPLSTDDEDAIPKSMFFLSASRSGFDVF